MRKIYYYFITYLTILTMTTLFAMPVAAKYKEGKVSNGGSIKGKIVFNGSVPTKRIVPTKDKDVCGNMRKEPRIMVGGGNGVANVVIYIKKISKGKAWPKNAESVLDQSGCRFKPHVQVMRPGNLTIVNSDPVLHNTHGYYGKRTAFNLAMPNKDQRVKKKLKRNGTVRVDCDAHGWMEGWVHVIDHPYYAVTSDDGTFSMKNVPDGTYKLTVWHEFAGTSEVSVTVKAGAEATANVELKK